MKKLALLSITKMIDVAVGSLEKFYFAVQDLPTATYKETNSCLSALKLLRLARVHINGMVDDIQTPLALNIQIRRLAGVDGNVTIKDGLAHLEDGEVIDLREFAAFPSSDI